jgi:hypothetical protein
MAVGMPSGAGAKMGARDLRSAGTIGTAFLNLFDRVAIGCLAVKASDFSIFPVFRHSASPFIP